MTASHALSQLSYGPLYSKYFDASATRRLIQRYESRQASPESACFTNYVVTFIVFSSDFRFKSAEDSALDRLLTNHRHYLYGRAPSTM